MIKRVNRRVTEPDPLRGQFAATVNGKPAVVEYEADRELRDTEQIPLTEDGGIEAFLRREVLPYAPDAWYVASSVKLGMRSALLATSTSPSRCGRSRTFGRTSSHSNTRRKASWQT